MAVGIRASIKSSIADWGDIIGEEITTVEKISDLKSEQEMLLEAPLRQNKPNASPVEPQAVAERLARNQERLEELLSSLPHSLQIVAEETPDPEEQLNDYAQLAREEMESTGGISLRCFWDATCERRADELQLGELVHIFPTDIGRRSGALIVHDLQGQSVGVVMNKANVPYYQFKEVLARAFYKSEFLGRVYHVDEKLSNSGRHYFNVMIDADELKSREDLFDSDESAA
jgi:hypothetical protein